MLGVEQGSSVENTVKTQTAKVKQTQSSSSKEEGRKGVHISSKTKCCPHRSSDDGLTLTLKNAKIADKEKRTQRTHSMEGGRKKRNGKQNLL
jgi:Cu/Zn superoxide dismutase